MIRISLLLISIVLGGCASHKSYDYTPQYCYTDQTITMNNSDTVNSKTVLECTDRPGQQTAIQRAGVDSSCREFWYSEKRYGKIVKQKGVACEKFDGTLEIVNINGNNS